VSRKCGSLDVSQPYEAPRLVTGIPLLYLYIRQLKQFHGRLPERRPTVFLETFYGSSYRNIFWKMIGREGSILWPSRSPDLTQLDFFSRGCIENYFYTRTDKISRPE
jgi:hypothetical protein